ncbi:hypothetical protein SAMN04488109_1388 [Chryseolinea serpens]
MGLQM